MRFGEKKVTKEELYGAKMPVKLWYVNTDNKVISNLLETNNNSKYFFGYLVEVVRPSVLMFPEMNRYVKISKET